MARVRAMTSWPAASSKKKSDAAGRRLRRHAAPSLRRASSGLGVAERRWPRTPASGQGLGDLGLAHQEVEDLLFTDLRAEEQQLVVLLHRRPQAIDVLAALLGEVLQLLVDLGLVDWMPSALPIASSRRKALTLNSACGRICRRPAARSSRSGSA
jgi:hypothetical protein